MKRSMMQVYVVRSDRAVALYQKAFDAELLCSYPYEDGTLAHSELAIQGEILAVSERTPSNAIEGETVTGTAMQFCLHYGEGGEDCVKKAYEVLKEGATVLIPLAPCEYSPLMADFIDRFGVRWCLFV